jgi:hypothetical protein
MADLQPFAGLSQEETNLTMLQLLAAILDKLPRVDANDRLLVNASEVAAATAAVTLASLATVSNLTALNTFGSGVTARPADAIPIHIANFGAQHIYNNIVVT